MIAVDGKGEMRTRAQGRRTAQPSLLAAFRSRAIARRARSISVIRGARLALAYAPVRGEVDPAPLIAILCRRGAAVAYPRMIGRGRLEFVVPDGDDGLRPGRYGIPEPGEGSVVSAGRAPVILVPGLAFSEDGARLGYGGGYYDAVLRSRSGIAVGLAFEFQVVPFLPTWRGDERLDALVTERRVIFFGRGHSPRSSESPPPT